MSVQRTCLGCAQTDSDPRHVIWVPGDVEVNWHMDCHRIATGCETCTEQTAGAEGLTGEELREHIITKDG